MRIADYDKRSYAAGYNRGAKWPYHLPPQPPNEIVADFMKAAIALRHAVDGYIAQFAPEDEVQESLGRYVDDLDAQSIRISKWLKTAPPN